MTSTKNKMKRNKRLTLILEGIKVGGTKITQASCLPPLQLQFVGQGVGLGLSVAPRV